MRASPFPVIHDNLRRDPYSENPPPPVLRVFHDVNNSPDSRVKKLFHSLNFQSRSAFKLLKLCQIFDFVGLHNRDGREHGDPRILDLGAVLGGWSQVIIWRAR